MAGGVDGLALGSVLAGSVFLYAAFTGKSVLKSVQAVVQGKSPSGTPTANPIAGSPAGSGAAPGNVTASTSVGISGGSAQALLQTAAAQHGWGSGPEWQALQNIEMAEAGYDSTATNPTSGAYGLAQAYGHGTAGSACPSTGRNEYGGYGLNDAEASAANCGNAGEQAVWMCNYIAQTYGDPIAAWQFHLANNSY